MQSRVADQLCIGLSPLESPVNTPRRPHLPHTNGLDFRRASRLLEHCSKTPSSCRTHHVSRVDVSDGKRLPFACSLALLQTVNITVPVDSDDPTHHAGLGKLRYLVLAPITKPNIRYSLFLVRCREHNAVGYRVEGISVTQLWWIIRTSAGMDRLDGCQECEKRVVAAPVPKDTTGASSGLEVTAQNTSYRSGHWRGQLNNYIQRNGLQSNIYWGTPQQVGPRHMPTWTISVFFNHIEYGRGSATRLDIAKETAAEQALKTLWGERGA
ncbi:hypothetical protein LXA43DRAFT_705536 [Ganoderma leucocontextum]|nr:hypothetical protein LXA43DRAFT_705536 [Ganoderma leucocontextum]